MHNALYYGDNLTVLREHVPDESVDLVYLDPPFNSNASYNVLFEEQSGEESPARIRAFTDTWKWTQEAERTFEKEIITNPETPAAVKDMISAFRQFIGSNAMMAYLVMMTPRLVELRRVMKPTGSVYLHCDPTASHYLKLLMDALFGASNFRNELVWHYGGRGAKAIAYQFPRNHDVLLFYSKEAGHHAFRRQYLERLRTFEEARKAGLRQDDEGRWFKTAPRGDYTEASIRRLDAEGRVHRTRTGSIRIKYFLRESAGRVAEDVLLGDTWSDIPDAMHIGKERLGYPTQKPQALLERIIRASSSDDDVVLDPFCGCGTAVAAAEKLGRRWIGIDVTHLAVALMKNRLKTAFDIVPEKDYQVVGEPVDVGSARALADQDRCQFQFWAMSLLEALPREQRKRDADRGIDGVIHFIDGPRRKGLVQVKSDRVSSPLIRDLKGAVDREKAALGLFITLEKPTREMRTEALSAGFYRSEVWQRDYPKIQIRTIEELLNGRTFEIPAHPSTYQAAQRIRRAEEGQRKLAPDSDPGMVETA